MNIISDKLLERLVALSKAADRVEEESNGESYVKLADRECAARVRMHSHRMSAWLIGAEVYEHDGDREVMLYGYVDLVGPDCAEWGPISLEEWESTPYSFVVEEYPPGRTAKEVIPSHYRF